MLPKGWKRKKVNKENGQKGAEEAHGEAAGRFGEGEGPEG
jgi:hypothetical protein